MQDRAPLLEIRDLPADDDLDLAIGMEDGPGGRVRVLTRTRGSVQGALPAAADIAQAEAAKTQGRLASRTPRAIRMPTSAAGDDQVVQLDYDVVEDNRGRNRPRSRAAPVRVVVMAKKGTTLRPRAR